MTNSSPYVGLRSGISIKIEKRVANRKFQDVVSAKQSMRFAM